MGHVFLMASSSYYGFLLYSKQEASLAQDNGFWRNKGGFPHFLRPHRTILYNITVSQYNLYYTIIKSTHPGKSVIKRSSKAELFTLFGQSFLCHLYFKDLTRHYLTIDTLYMNGPL